MDVSDLILPLVRGAHGLPFCSKGLKVGNYGYETGEFVSLYLLWLIEEFKAGAGSLQK